VLDGKVKVGPFIERHPLSDANRVLEAVHHREIKRRVVLTP
jgi:D-arabinose 1-dehydrogenase-like Zn-dependent alcohol dehydrogenase